MQQLYTSGVPFPFTLEYSCYAPNPEEIEKGLHIAFKPNRSNKSREFFTIAPEQAISILRLLHVMDTTETDAKDADILIDVPSKIAVDIVHKLKKGPKFNFEEMGIPIGSKLQFKKDPSVEVEVASSNTVYFEGQESSLTKVTRRLLCCKDVAPRYYWTFEGQLFWNIYKSVYKKGV